MVRLKLMPEPVLQSADPAGEWVRWDDYAELQARADAMEADAWRPIETAPMNRTNVIIATPTKDLDGWIIGEAYFDPENPAGGDWWWAGTSHGDYFSSPISDCNHWPPHFWKPLPAPPSALAQHGSKA